MAEILFGTRAFAADLVIFDKDGTLIDFVGLWAHYVINAVEALMATVEAPGSKPIAGKEPEALRGDLRSDLRPDLYAIFGYDPVADKFDPQSPVVTAPVPTLHTLAAGVLYRHGWGWLDAELEVKRSFDPIMNAPLPVEIIRATASLPDLFGDLRAAGVQIAVVTADDRAPTMAALTWLQVLDQVAFIACADDGYPYKPAPEAVWAACEATGVAPERAVMVGDSTTDMLMAQRAGLALRVAVLTGTMDATVLAPLADIVLESIGEIRVG
jgi:phosphoglycolate phosphatase